MGLLNKLRFAKMAGRFVYGLFPDGNAVEAQALANQGVIDSLPRFKSETKDRLFDICNGCGAGNALFDYVPDHLWFLYIGHCCHEHDYSYEMGDTAQDRLEADERWLRNMYEIIMLDKCWWRADWKLKRMAKGYYLMVRWKGKSAFNKKKYESSQLRFNRANGLPEDFNIDSDTIMDISDF